MVLSGVKKVKFIIVNRLNVLIAEMIEFFRNIKASVIDFRVKHKTFLKNKWNKNIYSEKSIIFGIFTFKIYDKKLSHPAFTEAEMEKNSIITSKDNTRVIVLKQFIWLRISLKRSRKII